MVSKQISIFIENSPGSLAAVTEVLAKSEVDIIALSLADTSEFGILRLIVDQPQRAQEALRAAGLIVKVSDVLAVGMDDRPGGLAGVVRQVTDAGLSIEYLYAFVSKQDGKAVVVMQLNDLAAAAALLNGDTSAAVHARDIYN